MSSTAARAPSTSPRAACRRALATVSKVSATGSRKARGLRGRDALGPGPELVAFDTHPGECRGRGGGPFRVRETEAVGQLDGPVRHGLCSGDLASEAGQDRHLSEALEQQRLRRGGGGGGRGGGERVVPPGQVSLARVRVTPRGQDQARELGMLLGLHPVLPRVQ